MSDALEPPRVLLIFYTDEDSRERIPSSVGEKKSEAHSSVKPKPQTESRRKEEEEEKEKGRKRRKAEEGKREGGKGRTKEARGTSRGSDLTSFHLTPNSYHNTILQLTKFLLIDSDSI